MAISRFPVAQLDDLPEDLHTRISAIQEKAGFIPNVFLALGHRPDELRAFMDYHDALMLRDGGLSKAEKEMIVVAVSGANNCLYCVVAHGAILRIYKKDPQIADQVAINYRKAAISIRERAMLDFALKVGNDPASISEADFEALSAVGFTQDDAWDIGSIAAFFSMSNRLANMSSMLPNDEFYLMGRQPKS
ncbi:MAG: peroxidase-related enzyme [Magnetovibrionaceae bacterium]